jgi:hypothetical protein
VARGARGSYDLGSCDRLQDHQEAAGIVFEDTASALFGVEGLQITGVQAGPGGALEAWAVTDYPAAAAEEPIGTRAPADPLGKRPPKNESKPVSKEDSPKGEARDGRESRGSR